MVNAAPQDASAEARAGQDGSSEQHHRSAESEAIDNRAQRRRNWAMEQLHRIGMYADLNAVDSHMRLSRMTAGRLAGNADPESEGEPVDAKQAAQLAENLPIGSNVSVVNQKDDITQQQINAGRRGWMAAGVLGACLAGLGGFIYGGGHQNKPAGERTVPAVIEWEFTGDATKRASGGSTRIRIGSGGGAAAGASNSANNATE